MTIIKEFKIGVQTYIEATRFIFKNGLWYYFLFPIVIAFIVSWGFVETEVFTREWAWGFINKWGIIKPSEPPVTEEQGWASNLWNSITNSTISFIDTLLFWVFKLMFFYLYFKVGKYLVLILVSPILAFLSEAVDKKITGNTYPFSLKQIAKDVFRGIRLAVRNMVIEFSLIIIGYFISIFFPLIWPFTMLFLWVIGWYFFGFSMIDYTNERKRLSTIESVTYVRNHKGLAIGNGIGFSVLFYIPILGAISAPIIGVVASTLGVCKISDAASN